MASALVTGLTGGSVVRVTGTGSRAVAPGCVAGKLPLPTDPMGNFTLTLTNVVVGSAIEVQTQVAGTSLYNGAAAASTVVIPLTAYATGSVNNDLRIKVRKGSASPYYQPYETLTTAFVGSQSIYCAQIADE